MHIVIPLFSHNIHSKNTSSMQNVQAYRIRRLILNRLINIISWRHLFTCCPAILIDRWGLYHLSFFNPFVVKLCPCFHEVLMLQNILFSFEKYNPKEKKREKQETKIENKTQDLLIPPPKKNTSHFSLFRMFEDIRYDINPIYTGDLINISFLWPFSCKHFFYLTLLTK